MVNAADSKSAERKLLRVRVSPPVPDKHPKMSNKVHKPLRNKGFFIFISPIKCYKIPLNPSVFGVLSGVSFS